jgi:hypothetical protein
MLVIYSPLAIEVRHREWIEAVRRAHDPQYALVEPHVTFLFPYSGNPFEAILAHAQDAGRRAPSISFRLARVAAVRDVFGPGSHVFLLPI